MWLFLTQDQKAFTQFWYHGKFIKGREEKARLTQQFFSSAPPVKKTQEKLHPPEKVRMLRLTTAEKWKAEDLAKYLTDQWLVFQTKNEKVLLMT